MTVDTGRVGTIRLASIIVLMIGTDIIATTIAETGDTIGNGAIAGIGAGIIAIARAGHLMVRCMA